DHEAATLAEPRPGVLDRALDGFALQRRAARKAHILEYLRHRLELAAHLADRLAGALDAGEHLQRRDESVTGGGKVRQHDMAGLLAADIEAVCAHVLHHVAIADLCAMKGKAEVAHVALEAEIGHHPR